MSLRRVSLLSRLLSTKTTQQTHRPLSVTPLSFQHSTKNKWNSRQRSKAAPGIFGGFFIASGFLSFFKKTDEEETPEQKLMMTIKRSILCVQREEYDKAEQMLHLALRMAQDLQSKDGITYVYDLMANLALEREQLKKAEKLFVDVMRRLFAEGLKEDDIKLLHISSKIAHIAQMDGQIDKAIQGFVWTLKVLEEKIKNLPDDQELQELWGLTKNWYGQALLENKNFIEAKKHLQEAFEVFTKLNGKLNSEAVTMLNNLSVICTYLEDYTSARKYLEEALELATQLPNMVETGMIKANLGLLYLKQGMLQQAKDACSTAWKYGKKANSKDIVEQANNCLKLIQEFDK